MRDPGHRDAGHRDATGLSLRPLAAGDEAQARAAQAELAPEGFAFLFDERPGETWTDYVARREQMRHGRALAPGQVAETFLVAEVAGRLVGRVSIRHALTPWLREHGGHIGYGVRAADRRRGYATAMLRHALAVAGSVGVAEALLTCDEHNVASARVVEACGGRFERLAAGVPGEPPKRRYLVATHGAELKGPAQG